MRLLAAAVVLVVLPVSRLNADDDAASTSQPAWWLQKAVAFASEIPEPDLRSDISYSLVNPLAETGQWNEAVRLARLVKNPQTNVYAHTRIATLAHQAGNTSLCQQELAAARATAIESQNLWAITDIVTKSFQLGFEDEAKAVAAAIRDPMQRDYAYQQMADELASRGRVDEALQIGTRLRSAGDQFYGRLANACANAQRIDDVERLLPKISDPKRSDIARRILVQSLSAAGRKAEARAQAEKIVAQDLREQLIAQTEQSSQPQLNAVDLRKEFDAATTRTTKLAMGEKLFCELLKEEQPAEAEALIPKLVEAVRMTPREPERSKFGNVDDDTVVLMQQCKALQIAPLWQKKGDADRARRVLAEGRLAYQKMPESSGLAKILLTETLLAAHLALDDFEGLEKSIEAPTNELFRSKQLSAIAAHQIRSGDVATGLKTAEQIRGEHAHGHELGRVAVALIDSPMPEQALHYLKTIGNTMQEADAFDDVAKAMLERNRGGDLADWTNRMPSAATRSQLCLGAARALLQKLQLQKQQAK